MRKFLLTGTTALTLVLAACSPASEEKAAAKAPTAEDAKAFIAEVEKEYNDYYPYAARTYWIQANFVTVDSNALVAKVSAEGTAMAVKFANEAKKFNDVEVDFDTRRKLELLKQGITLPAPTDEAENKELAELTSELDAMYATGKDPKGRNDRELIKLMAESRNPDELLEAWEGWRTVSPPMKEKYARMVEIANEGARELGYKDVGAMWRAGYDMPADEFRAEADRLWEQVKPLYTSLHCYVRAKLGDKYGTDKVPQDGAIPAHLLGNMWAQQWGNIYDLVKPGDSDIGYDLTARLKAKDYDEVQMVKTGENFFSSLGFAPLPETFWERSLIKKPRDREVQCHASAWSIDNKDDIRIKMCTQITADDFETIHHELGHNYYQRAYNDLSILYQSGANDGFHEAIGDTIALSITPAYLKQIGLIDEVPSAEGDIGLLMSRALDKVAFLPFGLMVDQWRWKVFNGELTPDTYNSGWWELREKYQGVKAPVDRAADAFDPGAKYHIPGNTPYMRYFLAHILQFQFHKAACEMAGFKGPLHRCTIYDNKEVGEKFNAMLEMGQSRPWQEALQAFTGESEMDASAVLEYFAPLQKWLDEQNEGRSCGW
ncbi:M2 family metallopeptidase [Emcibacter nanhaiensis]|uniref:M2 family metallopeptidase n=1 Tax=Emcibacter nanhaiensis TaxID=1505037 RepID=A0A501PN59_9PROT|nr:M2 family metallopeptidase [Emcibacter nanhaiensis]TPD61598.1 M2 family metallopeptidase [Emcibacter nanhaiensis]